MIITDTREQKPLWDPAFFNVKIQKLNEGDYTTEDLLGIAHVERKSGIDLYGSITQGHTRFRNELKRAIEKNVKLAVFVECTREDFFRKKFKGGYRLQADGETLLKIISTISNKYNVEFVWCEDRDDLRDKICLWFVNQRKILRGEPEIAICRSNVEAFRKERKEMVNFKNAKITKN